MKTLFINRHAKSSWKEPGLRDFDRPLNKRGKINAEFMAKKFADEEKIDAIITSTAVRAISTADQFARACGIGYSEMMKEQAIYGAGIQDMMRIINSISTDEHRVMLFGHNPTFSDLAHYLDPNFHEDLVTCARVKIEFDVTRWDMVSGGIGTVAHHIYPRMYPEMAEL